MCSYSITLGSMNLLRTQTQEALGRRKGELKCILEGKDTITKTRIGLVQLFSASKDAVISALYWFYKNPRGMYLFPRAADSNLNLVQNLHARAVEENERFSKRVRGNGSNFHFASPTDNSVVFRFSLRMARDCGPQGSQDSPQTGPRT